MVARSYEIAANAVGDAKRIVDLGANTGIAARWFLERFPNATIVSVEPERGNAAVLRHNLSSYADRAHMIDACIGARPRRVTMAGTPGNEFGFTMTEVPGGDTEVVTMESVLQLFGGDRIDLLKCDIEGAERELFESSATWLSKVDVLAVECHGEFTARRLVGALEANGVTGRQIMFESTPQFGCEQIVLALAE